MPEPILSAGLMVAGYSAIQALSRPRSAISAEAEAVRANASIVVEQVNRSVALYGPKARLISALATLGEECSEPNWDGYGALPVSHQAIRRAGEIIASLPDDLLLPDCSAEPDGSISFDWMPDHYRTLTLSVGLNDRIPYAWVDGTNRGHAVARLIDSRLPLRILEEIRRFASHDSTIRATL
jgi:hypothetical protein